MTSDFIYRWGLRLGGTIIFLIGLGHILMPSYGYSPSVLEGWSSPAIDHFYYLATYIICGFLISIGLLSLIYSNHGISRITAWFTLVISALWLLRLALELLYPVKLQIFFLANPNPVLLAVLSIACAGYIISALAAWRTILAQPLKE